MPETPASFKFRSAGARARVSRGRWRPIPDSANIDPEQMKSPAFGLIGTISRDEIVHENGPAFHQLGGILYQAALLCGLGEDTILFANLAEGLAAEVEAVIGGWPSLRREGIRCVPGSGNRVRLFYPREGERREILESAVPELDPAAVVGALSRLDFLVTVVNSGLDLSLASWREIADSAACPIWFDIHSLTLARVLGVPRSYRPVPEWKEWVQGAAYLQANRQEVACMLGRPDSLPSEADLGRISAEALEMGIKAVFITLGAQGGLVATPEATRQIRLGEGARVVDTTGCGDVFAAAAVSRLARGVDPLEAASFGLELASRAASSAGIEEVFRLARGL
jgi:hypothetical protein